MGTENPSILTVNAGSSSIKINIFEYNTLDFTLSLTVKNLDQSQPKLISINNKNEQQTEFLHVYEDQDILVILLDKLFSKIKEADIKVIGHRIVHSGKFFTKPELLNPDKIAELKKLINFDPEHMTLAINFIEAFQERLKNIDQVACFDTSFYNDMPAIAKLLPIPRKYEALGLRRYGFHGLAYESALDSFNDLAGDSASNGNLIFAHLGSGASITALKEGKVKDTTMSFSTASGILMSTRSGDIDPGISSYLNRQAGLSNEEFNHMVHFQSGLLGVSELSSDMEELLKEYDSNPRAKDAVDLFCYEAKKAIGSLTTVLGGINSLIFSGGIGEQSPVIRQYICSDLEYLGLKLDDEKNSSNDTLISSSDSQIGAHVIKVDEAIVIARHVKELTKNIKDDG
ncbi:MAG TPA: acetate/propionate family kinase [Patescibacteria group bacterium]|nr:acetate/propionate family kinase [Patescibacteria group bacterium]